MHGVEWVWLIMVSPLMVSHVDWDGCVKCGEEVVGTCEHKKERSQIRKQQSTVKQIQ